MGLFFDTKPLDCWHYCADLYECMRNQRPIFETQCPQCGNGNRFRITTGLWRDSKFEGVTQCQMGKAVLIGTKEMCDDCQAEEKRKEEHYKLAREIVKDNALVQTPALKISEFELRRMSPVIRAEHEDRAVPMTFGGLVIPTNQEVVEIGLGIYQLPGKQKKSCPEGRPEAATSDDQNPLQPLHPAED